MSGVDNVTLSHLLLYKVGSHLTEKVMQRADDLWDFEKKGSLYIQR